MRGWGKDTFFYVNTLEMFDSPTRDKLKYIDLERKEEGQPHSQGLFPDLGPGNEVGGRLVVAWSEGTSFSYKS